MKNPYGMRLKIKAVDYHRNGCAGVGFTVVLFTDVTERKAPRNMVASIWDDSEGRPRGYYSVFDVDLLAAGNVRFGENSWRGNVYTDALKPLLEKWEAKHALTA